MKIAAALVMVASAGLAYHAGTHAQTYPHKPVRLTIPYPPGGDPNIVGRLIAAKLYERLDKWWGMLAPAGTPTPIVNRLTTELKTILASDEIKKRFLNEGAEVDYLGLAEFGLFLQRETTKWASVVKKANIKVE